MKDKESKNNLGIELDNFIHKLKELEIKNISFEEEILNNTKFENQIEKLAQMLGKNKKSIRENLINSLKIA